MLTDHHARTQALIPDQSFIVQAPAGSGKTELLTQRILSLLANNAKSPESVLAITFTRKAAHEMRLRVLKALQAGRDPVMPTAAHQQLTWKLARQVLAQDEIHDWNLLSNPQRLQIMTIDSLCASLVRQMPVLSEMGGMPTISENAKHLYEQAAITTITDLLRAEDPYLQTLLLHLDNRQQSTVELISDMLAKREQWLPVIIQCPHDHALRQLLEDNLSIVITHLLENFVGQIDDEAWESLKPLLRFSLDHVSSNVFGEELESLFDWPWPLPFDVDTLPTWKALYQWIFTTTGTVRKSPDKRQGFPAATDAKDKAEKALFASMKNDVKIWLENFSEDLSGLEAWRSIPYLPQPVYSEPQWEVLLALFHVLPHACAQLQIHLQTHSEIDFSGVAQAARVALGHQDDPSALTLKLDYQLQHILIDEFQDTSLQQYALIEKLIAGWIPGDGRTLFLVGDPMQSIYRFRQAEVGLFVRVQEQGLGDLSITPLHLTANFRSDPSIIRWINQHAVGCFSAEPEINLGAIPYSPSDPARDPYPGAQVAIHATGDLIPCVLNLLENTSLQSIAILVRARSHLADITVALKNANVAYQAVELEGLAVQALVQDLMSLTRAIIHLADAVAWLSLLRAPFCGFCLADITIIRQTDPSACVWDNLNAVDLSLLSDEGQRIWHRVHPILSACLHHRMSGRLSLTIEHLWIHLGGPACLLQESDLLLATSFFNTLAKYDKGGTLPDLHHMMDRLEAAFVKSSPGVARIQIMTLHKAKGLEFDAVLLPELQRETRAKDQPLLLWEEFPTESGQSLLIAPVHPTQGDKDPLYQFLKYTREQKEAHEKGRLLYVGMTRAKRQLHLFARLNQNDKGEIADPRQGSLLSLVWPTLAEEFCMVFEPVSELNQESAGQVIEPSLRLSPDWIWPHDLKLATFLAQSPDIEDNTVPMQDYAYDHYVQRQQGVLLHRMLYKIAIQGLPAWDSRDLVSLAPCLAAQVRELGVMRGVDAVVKTILDALQKTLQDPRGRWILDAHPEHEAEAVYGSAIIDRTFVDKDGVRWVIDYKTTAPQQETMSAFYHAQFEQYRSQLAKYAQIFASRGEKNIRCAIYFPLCGGWYESEIMRNIYE